MRKPSGRGSVAIRRRCERKTVSGLTQASYIRRRGLKLELEEYLAYEMEGHGGGGSGKEQLKKWQAWRVLRNTSSRTIEWREAKEGENLAVCSL